MIGVPRPAPRGGVRAAAAAGALQALVLASARAVPGAAPGRWRDPAAWAFAGLLVTWSALEAGLARPGREPARPGAIDRALATVTGVALLVGAWLGLRTAPDFTLRSWALGAAAAGLAAGVALRVAAVHRLGARFLTGAVAVGPLVTDGVYGRVRHPSEAGLVVAAACGGLLLRSAPALALAAAVVLPAALARVRREERVLAAAHAEAHAAWRRTTGRLVPRLGRWPPGRLTRAGSVRGR